MPTRQPKQRKAEIWAAIGLVIVIVVVAVFAWRNASPDSIPHEELSEEELIDRLTADNPQLSEEMIQQMIRDMKAPSGRS